MQVKSIKCVIVGDGAVGKTSLLISYTTNAFITDYIPTIFDNYSCNLIVDGKTYSIVLWDTAGQEDYSKLRSFSYPHTDVFIICYAINLKSSYDNIKDTWVPEITHYCPNVPFILVGTKSDLKVSDSVDKPNITYEQGMYLARDIGASDFFECSALTQKNLKAVFDQAVKTVIFDKKPNKKKNKCLIL